MIQIDDVVISLDVFREKFLCDLGACKGECCIEGDAGAPVEMDEVAKLEEVLPVIWDDLAPEAKAIIDKQGVVYTDEEGDLVTSIVNGKDCVFTCYDEKGSCYCAIEKAYRAGKVDFCKPVSCALYPIRVGDYGPYKAVNYHRWNVCKAAVLLGQKENLPVYKFLKEPKNSIRTRLVLKAASSKSPSVNEAATEDANSKFMWVESPLLTFGKYFSNKLPIESSGIINGRWVWA